MPTLISLMTLRRDLPRILSNDELDNNFVNLANGVDSKSPVAGPGPGQAFSTGALTVAGAFGLNISGGNVYGHGGSVIPHEVLSPSNTANSQAMYFVSSGFTGSGASALGGMTAALPGLAPGLQMSGWSAFTTESSHAPTAPRTAYTVATRGSDGALERLRVTSAGNLLVGTPIDDGSGARVQVAGGVKVHGKTYTDQIQWLCNINVSGSNMDDLLTSGFYDGNGLTNAPGTGWYHIAVQASSQGTSYVKQTVTEMTDTVTRTFIRIKTTGWGLWRLVAYA